jgi:hypothetical protein
MASNCIFAHPIAEVSLFEEAEHHGLSRLHTFISRVRPFVGQQKICADKLRTTGIADAAELTDELLDY